MIKEKAYLPDSEKPICVMDTGHTFRKCRILLETNNPYDIGRFKEYCEDNFNLNAKGLN